MLFRSSQLFEVLDQSVTAQAQAKLLMLRAAQAFPGIKLFGTAPGIGPNPTIGRVFET